MVTTFMCLSTSTLVNLKITYFCACNATVQQHMYANKFSFSWLVNYCWLPDRFLNLLMCGGEYMLCSYAGKIYVLF